MVECREVGFFSGEERCAARLYLPEQEPRPAPGVVMAHGIAGTMDLGLDPYAARFAATGMAVLCFDYRHFGASEGWPRQVVDVRRQVEDVRSAVGYLRHIPQVDHSRVGLWGTSLGAGHAVSVAAADPELVAVVAQLPFFGVDLRRRGPRPLSVAAWLVLRAVADAVDGRLARPGRMVPLVGVPGDLAVFAGEDDDAPMRALEASAPRWRNELAARSLFSLMRYRPVRVAAEVRAPLLILAAAKDAATSVAAHPRGGGRGAAGRDADLPWRPRRGIPWRGVRANGGRRVRVPHRPPRRSGASLSTGP